MPTIHPLQYIYRAPKFEYGFNINHAFTRTPLLYMEPFPVPSSWSHGSACGLEPVIFVPPT